MSMHHSQTKGALSFFTNDGEGSRGNNDSIFTFKVPAFRLRCLHLESSHTRNCRPAWALIIHPEPCASPASAPGLCAYLDVCLPLGLHLQLPVQPAVYNWWRVSPLTGIIKASPFPAICNLSGSSWQRVSS